MMLRSCPVSVPQIWVPYLGPELPSRPALNLYPFKMRGGLTYLDGSCPGSYERENQKPAQCLNSAGQWYINIGNISATVAT